ncbi:MAG: tRNA (guanosine(46)-N7)-methyltransferase TrmB, partial [Mycoplasmataceae bacterium]|nr:tRNA (guanosine(46)-N7)-methyltransferase TrmB [Mycoplasmataceae bacterium]
MRLRNNPLANELLEKHNSIIKKIPIELDENTILEIGMGKGEMITKMALNQPLKKFIGIEKFPTVILKALKVIDEKKISNLNIVCQDILKLENSFEGKAKSIWLTFSDPWPKKRHYKRRLTYKKYLDIYKNILSDEGILLIKTDNDLLYNFSIESLIEYGAKIIYKTTDLYSSEKIENNIQT